MAAATLKQVQGIGPAMQARLAGPAGDALRDEAVNHEHVLPVAERFIAEPTSQTIRTALCVEAREGRMHVFMPPISLLEDYLHLVEAIEDTAEELAMPVMIEGYTPPGDHRLQHFKVTPDPGVIEVNLQPSANWQELMDNTTTLYDEARRSRLGTEKFMIDGRHTGTGGGNHIVLGGAEPIDSPFLRRPTCCEAWWPIGTTGRVCPTCFRACSSGPRARPRGWTRPAMRVFMNWKRRSRSSPLPPGEGWGMGVPRRGWSIGCSAICWSI